MLLRDGVDADWAQIWPFFPSIWAAGDTYTYPQDVSEEWARAVWMGEHVLVRARELGYRAMQFNAVVETNTRAVRLWESLGFVTLCTVPEAFAHPEQGLVGLCVMHRPL